MIKRIGLFLIIIIAIGVIGISLRIFLQPKFNVDFATSVFVTYKYDKQDIKQKINDKNTINQLKSILKGRTFVDTPSCGFSTDISITFSNNKKSVTLCPACDGCPIIRINDSNKYFAISDEDREKLNRLLAEYGFEFPCVWCFA